MTNTDKLYISLGLISYNNYSVSDSYSKCASAPVLNDKETRLLSRLQAVPGLVVAHGLGTGKTRASIQIADQFKNPTSVIVPASLKDNYKKELNKWLNHIPDYVNIHSQQGVARQGLKRNNGDLMILDEAHRARDPSSKLYKALAASNANKRLLLTATPVYNHPVDLAALVNLAANKKILPEDKKEFSKKFIKEESITPGIIKSLLGLRPGIVESVKEHPDLISAINKYVDYEPGQDSKDFPAFKEEVVKVPMLEDQQAIYNTILDKAPLWVRLKVKAGLPPNRTELKSLQTFLTGARQASNSTYDFVKNKDLSVSPKIDKAVSYLKNEINKNPNYKALIYSNYLGSGLIPYKTQLDREKIPYGEFSGSIEEKIRNQTIRDYNNNKLKALLISTAGAEGLDLKGTRLLQILEPHFNREKEKQIAGRAIRYKSHSELPEQDRNVLIQRYIAQPKGNWLDRLLGNPTVKGTDDYIGGIADRKDMLNKQLMDLIIRQQNKHYRV
jgi:SNF2 family DNA or RNA helicase